MVKEEHCKKCGAVTQYSTYSSINNKTNVLKISILTEPCTCENFYVGKIKKMTGGDTFMTKEDKNSKIKK
uniref:Uncharacterized protein n=1 Tax=viral metagenome TaxID=1070528 RepID=A0A6C0AFL9_9ZZZZ